MNGNENMYKQNAQLQQWVVKLMSNNSKAPWIIYWIAARFKLLKLTSINKLERKNERTPARSISSEFCIQCDSAREE